jgi:putative lipoic acid-binding regulatory protein
MTAEETRLEFPCDFPIKAMGRADVDIAGVVVEIVRRHAPGLDETRVTLRPSSGGKWVAVTLTIEATSNAQLDAIYTDLTAHDQIVWAL